MPPQTQPLHFYSRLSYQPFATLSRLTTKDWFVFMLKIPERIRRNVRDKAISKAETRILLAGRKPEDFDPDELEIIVNEEEDKLYSAFKEKGLLALLALLGISWFG